MVASKLFGLLTIFMAFAVLHVNAMQCTGPNLNTKKDGLLCGGQYVPYDGVMCGNICSCNGGTLTCNPPSDCTAQTTGWDSVEDFCHIGPNYDWSCQCPEKQEDADVLIVVPPPADFTPPSTTSNGDHPFHGPEIFPTPHPSASSHPTTMHTSIVPKSSLEKNIETCTFRLGNGGCDDEFPVEVVINEGQMHQCISATNAFGFGSYSYEVTSCSSSFEICYLFNDNVCNGGSFENALTYKNYEDQKCFPKPGGDGFAISSIFCA